MRKLLLYSFCLLIIFSCENNEENIKIPYKVDPEFEPYVQRFVLEAAKRGKHIDLTEEGMIIEFVDNLENHIGGDGNIFGYCTFHERRITMDRGDWEGASELDRTRWLFHELGHCFLNRMHHNELLPNGEWASIMRGGIPEIKKSWVTNFTGKRIDYYIDELFDENTAVPKWAMYNFTYNDQYDFKEIILEDHFSKFNNTFSIGKTKSSLASIKNDYYELAVNSNVGRGGLYNSNRTTQLSEDYELELRMKLAESIDENYTSSGITWGNEREMRYYLRIAKNGKIIFGDWDENGIVYSETLDFNPEEFNVYTIRKIGPYFYFFINSEFIYHTDYAQFHPNYIGIWTTQNSTTQVDWAKFSNILQSPVQ